VGEGKIAEEKVGEGGGESAVHVAVGIQRHRTVPFFLKLEFYWACLLDNYRVNCLRSHYY
jgi:hypothetical protein